MQVIFHKLHQAQTLGEGLQIKVRKEGEGQSVLLYTSGRLLLTYLHIMLLLHLALLFDIMSNNPKLIGYFGINSLLKGHLFQFTLLLCFHFSLLLWWWM